MMNRYCLQAAVTCAAITVSSAAWAQYQTDRDRQSDRDRTLQPRDRGFGTQQRMQSVEFERLTKLRNRQVESQDGDRLGRLENIAVDPQSGRALYCIVTTERMDDAADNRKIVPISAIRSRGEDRPLQLTVSASRFKNAPSFDQFGWANLGEERVKQSVKQHYGVSMDSEKYSDSDRFRTERDFDDDFFESDDRGRVDARTTARRASIVRATDMLGYRLLNNQRQNLGEIEDVVLDMNRGHLAFVVLRPAEQISTREDRLVVAPWAKVQYDSRDRTLALDLDRQELRDAPSFASDRWPDITNPAIADRVFAYYDVQPDFILGYTPPQDRGMIGWEHRSQYNRRFNADQIQTVSGEVTAIERFTPMSGMGEGVRLRIRTDDGQTRHVHLGPAWFFERQDMQLQQGDDVEVRGCRTEIDGQTVIMATQVTSDNRVLLLRDPDGTPRWHAALRHQDLENIRNKWRERAGQRSDD